MVDQGESLAHSTQEDLLKLLRMLLIIVSLGAGFCLLRSVVRGLLLLGLIRACGVPPLRLWAVLSHYNDELVGGTLSVCEVASAKLFVECSTAASLALVGCGFIVALTRARQLAKRLAERCRR
jgi:hypothetical protein